jgi:hypothetical protein
LSELGGDVRLDWLVDGRGKPLRLMAGEIHGPIDASDAHIAPSLAKGMWGQWYGREADFYRACADRIKDLSWAEVRAKASAQLDIQTRRAAAAFAHATTKSLPKVLCMTNVELTELDETLVQLRSTFSPNQAIRLEQKVVDALVEFDGRPTDVAVASIRDEHDVVIDEPLLRKLYERGIVVRPDGRDIPRALQPADPLTADDELSFFRGFGDWAVEIEESRGDDGKVMVLLACGAKEVEFDEPELLDFARALVKHQNGFRAKDATRWGADGGELSWEWVEELLNALLAENVLQRRPMDVALSAV